MGSKIILFSIGMLMALFASFLGLIIAYISYRKHKRPVEPKPKGD